MRKKQVGEIAAIVILIGGAVIFMFPFYWMVIVSFKPAGELTSFLPKYPQFKNYLEAVRYIPFFRYFYNTVHVTFLATTGMVLSSSFVAYGFTKVEWPGREIIFAISLGTMMIPFMVIMVPLYIEFKAFGWLGSLKPLWLPAWFASAWNIFFLRQFYRGIPTELVDAAKIDGASHLQIWAKIIIPLSKPALAVAVLFHFVYVWRDFLAPLVFITSQKMYTLALGLNLFQSRSGGTQWNYLMAASVLTTIPTIIIFFFVNRHLIKGIRITAGLKE